MSAFNTHKILDAAPSLVPAMADKIANHFRVEGYEVDVRTSDLGTYDISMTKGGVFKAVLGMKTALKVTLKPGTSNVTFDAGIGIFGQQLIPTVIMLFVAWPVILTQMWGLVQQAGLDDQALALAESVIPSDSSAPKKPIEPTSISSFCPECGSRHDVGMRYCPGCGRKL